jgi:transposase-like protein
MEKNENDKRTQSAFRNDIAYSAARNTTTAINRSFNITVPWKQWSRNSHLPIRRPERRQQLFKSQASAERFLPPHAEICNTFDTQRHLISRPNLRRFRAGADAAWAVTVDCGLVGLKSWSAPQLT